MPGDLIRSLRDAVDRQDLAPHLRNREDPGDASDAWIEAIIDGTVGRIAARIGQDSRSEATWSARLAPGGADELRRTVRSEARAEQVRMWFSVEIGPGFDTLVTELGTRYPTVGRDQRHDALQRVVDAFLDADPDGEDGDEPDGTPRRPYRLAEFFPATPTRRAHIRDRLLDMAADRLDRERHQLRRSALSAAVEAAARRTTRQSDRLQAEFTQLYAADQADAHYLTDHYASAEVLAGALDQVANRSHRDRSTARLVPLDEQHDRDPLTVEDDYEQRIETEQMSPASIRERLRPRLATFDQGWAALYHHLDALARGRDVWTTVPARLQTPEMCWRIWSLLDFDPRIRDEVPDAYLRTLCCVAADSVAAYCGQRCDVDRDRRLLEVRMKSRWGMLDEKIVCYWRYILGRPLEPGTKEEDEKVHANNLRQRWSNLRGRMPQLSDHWPRRENESVHLTDDTVSPSRVAGAKVRISEPIAEEQPVIWIYPLGSSSGYLVYGGPESGNSGVLDYIRPDRRGRTWARDLITLVNRGLHGVLLACVDGSPALRAAIGAALPNRTIVVRPVRDLARAAQRVVGIRDAGTITDLREALEHLGRAADFDEVDSTLATFKGSGAAELYPPLREEMDSWRNDPGTSAYLGLPAAVRRIAEFDAQQAHDQQFLTQRRVTIDRWAEALAELRGGREQATCNATGGPHPAG